MRSKFKLAFVFCSCFGTMLDPLSNLLKFCPVEWLITSLQGSDLKLLTAFDHLVL